MAYDDPSQGETENMPQDSEREDTFFLPTDFPGKEDYKPGDTIELKVVGASSDGGLEVECVHGDGKSWKTDLRDHMAEKSDEEGM